MVNVMEIDDIRNAFDDIDIDVKLAVLAMLLVASVKENERNRIDAGTIVDRYFHSWGCDNKYWFVIESEKRRETVKNGFEVTKKEYERYKIGDFYER